MTQNSLMLNTIKNKASDCPFCSTFLSNVQKEFISNKLVSTDCCTGKRSECVYDLNVKPMINGTNVTLNDAIFHFKELLKNNNQGHINGLSSDQQTIQSVLNFAEKKKYSINHMHDEQINNFFFPFQKFGSSLSSFNELKNRSDLLIFVNIEENLLCKTFLSRLGWKTKKMKNCFFILNQTKKLNCRFKTLKLSNLNMINLLNNLKTLHEIDKMVESKNTKYFFDIFYKSKYPVFILNSSNINQYLAVSIFNFIKNINKKKRVKIFNLLGADNSGGFINSCVSKTGYPNAVNFTENGAEYEPDQLKTVKLKKYIDLQIYFSNFRKTPCVNFFNKNVLIGHPNSENKEKFDIFIPTVTPGIDGRGLIVRSDGIGVIKLEKVIDSNYFTTSYILNQIS